MSSDNTAIGVFLRRPVPGRVKRRLAQTIGDEVACKVYRKFIRKTALKVRKLRQMNVYYFCTPAAAIEQVKREFDLQEPVYPQKGGDLGARMKNAFTFLLKHHPRAMLIGTDTPHLPPLLLRAGEKTLKQFPLALGPAEDGGYYLIGLTRGGFKLLGRRIFSRIRWGTGEVLLKTVQKSRQAGVIARCLPVWYDIDRFENLKRAGYAGN